MFRHCLVLLAGFCVAQSAAAASWADAMFQELSKDFGSVPRGPTLQHSFHLRNNSTETVRIASLRVSCGCVTATALQNILQPGEETAVLAQMDTTRFTGIKSVTIYVMFDQPHSEEVRLWVRANGRDDFNVTPDTLAFGQIKRGSNPSVAVRVTFYGDSQAQLLSAQAESNYVRPSIRELRRQGTEVAYEVTAKLRSDAPVGKWYTDVWLSTNNESMPRVRVPLTVEIESLLSISPVLVTLGDVKKGDEAERRVIVRGVKPFKITGVKGTDSVVSVRDSANVSKPVHVLTVKVRGKEPGEVNRSLQVETDLQGDSSIEFYTRARIVP
jgi:Protein of unknown function (DUF1573)